MASEAVRSADGVYAPVMSEVPTSDRKGQCLCGAIRFTARGVKLRMSACHCGMCRRWAGGPFFSAVCAELDYEGEGRPRTVASSKWAERGFCAQCGSAIFYRLTAEGPYEGLTSVAIGTLDDPEGFEFEREWFIDRKPTGYAFVGERESVTEAQALAMFDGG